MNLNFNDDLLLRKTFNDSLFKRSESLAKCLPYDEYIEKYGIYLNRDGTLGAIFDVELVEHEPLSGPEIISKVKSLQNWFQLPENCVVQILHDQSVVSEHDEIWNKITDSYPAPAAVSQKIIEDRISLFKRLSKSNSDLKPMKRKTFLTVKYIPSASERKKWISTIANDEKYLFAEMKSFLGEVRDFHMILEQYLKNSKIKLNKVAPDELLESLRQFFNPVEFYKRSFSKFNKNIPISDQIIYSKPELDHSGISREGVKTRVITLKAAPQYAVPGAISDFLKLSFPFRITLNVSIPTKSNVKRFMNYKYFFLQSTPNEKSKLFKEDLQKVENRIARGDRCVHATFFLVIEGATEDELDSRTREILSVVQNDLECEAIVENEIGCGMALSSLPLFFSPETDQSTQRFLRVLSSDLTTFIPVFDSFRGLEVPQQLYLSRENNIVSFSPTENPTSNHTVVLGDTGSGKSAFVLDTLAAAQRLYPSPLTFVIEKKASSRMLCKYLGGEDTVFHLNESIPFTPFRGKFDDSKVNFLRLLILNCIKLTNPSFNPESEHSSIIQKALKVAYLRKQGNANSQIIDDKYVEAEFKDEVIINMDDVVAAIGSLRAEDEFEEMSSKIEDLINKLRPFYSDGTYAKCFKGTDSTRTDNDCNFFIYDLDALDSDPVLKELMTFSVFEEIRRIITLPDNRGRGGFIVCEELGQLGKNNPTAAEFIIDFAETLRKYGFWLIGIAPRPENFFETEAGRAVWSCSDNFVFMNMKESSVEFLKNNTEMIDEVDGDIINSLETIKDRYAEAYYTNKSKTKRGAFRFVPSAIDRWIAPTNSQDAKIVEDTLNRFDGDAWKTLTYLTEEYSEKEAA